MPDEFPMDLREIPDEESAKMYGEILLEELFADEVLKKQVGKDFLNKCQRNLQDEKASPQLKYNTLLIFNLLDFKNKNSVKLFSIVTGHPIFAYFLNLAKTVDPRKSVSEKGKNLFPTNRELGNKFMRLLLESIKYWNDRFPNNSQQQPTKFKKSFNELQKEGVTFPTTYTMYGPSEQKGGIAEQKPEKLTPTGDPSKYGKSSSANQKQATKIQTKSPTVSGGNETTGSQQKVTKSSIMLLFNKIQSFISFLQDSENEDQVLREINKNHKTFEKQQKRLQKCDISTIPDERIISLYLKINQFFVSEQEIYEEWVVRQDSLKMYVESLYIKYDSIFAEELAEEEKGQQKPQKSKAQKQQEQSRSTIKNEQKSKNVYNSTTSNKENSKQEKRKYQSVASQKQPQNKKRRQEYEEQNPKLKEKKSNQQSQEIKDRALRSFFDSHLQKPVKKSLSGFKAIKQSIQKQKKDLKSKVRGKSPLNSMNKSKFNASTVSKIQTNSIFAKPPNPNVRSKKYEGTMIPANYQIQNAIHDIQRQQGMKRFKVSNLKSRALLYQSEHIQVGYKSQPIYERVPELDAFSCMIQLEVFIGNKTTEKMRDVNVAFLGDQKSLVYSNPQKAPETINGGEQSLFTVIIIPCAQTYSMTTMQISYKYESTPVRSICVLPSTILKFSTYQRADIRDMSEYERSQAIKCYQSQKFQLSHYFPPRKLQHYIEELTEISSYSEFVENGSEKDFVLGAFCLIKNKFEALLKINVRPDLNVVLQLMSDNESEQAQKQLKLYLQTLWMVLKEHR